MSSLSSLKSMGRNACPNLGKLSLCLFGFNLSFSTWISSLFSLLFVVWLFSGFLCPLWFIFPFFSHLCFSYFASRGFASLFWLVSMFSHLCLSCFRFCFRSRGFAICLSLLMFCFVWKLTLSLFIGKGKGSRNRNTTTGTCDITSTTETIIMEATMAAEA